MNKKWEGEIIDTFDQLNADYESIQEALFGIESEVQCIIGGESVTGQAKTSKKIDEIRQYVECLIHEKSIDWSSLYYINQQRELQNIYNSISAIEMDKFHDGICYNLWKSYIEKGNISIVITNHRGGNTLNLRGFKDLEFDELEDLENLFIYGTSKSITVELGSEVGTYIKH